MAAPCSRAARPSSSATCRSGSSWTRSTSTSPGWTHGSSTPSAKTSAGSPALQDERYRAHRAVRELLERVAARGPVVLVLDDVHWADTASVELLAALLRSPPDAAVLLVLAARPRQWPDRLTTA